MYQQCINSPNAVANTYKMSNCYIFDNTAGQDKCIVCNAGYYLTMDFSCEQITIKNCSSFTPPIYVDTSAVSPLNSLIAHRLAQTTGLGCQSCGANYQLVNMSNTGTATDHSLDVCGVSSYVQTTSFNTYATMKYCTQFGKNPNSDVVGCFACSSGYVPKSDFTQCLVNTNIPNCALATDTTNCLTCNSGYSLYLSGGNLTCGNSSTFVITNCSTHFSNANTTVTNYNLVQDGSTIPNPLTGQLSTTKFLCTQCSNQYYLQTNGTAPANYQLCTLGTITNCLTYKSQYRCS